MISLRYLELLSMLEGYPPGNETTDDLIDHFIDAWDSLNPDLLGGHQFFRLAFMGVTLLTKFEKTSRANIVRELIDLHKRKNVGYSGDDLDPWRNFREIERFGISAKDGCLTRLCDKYRRFMTVYSDSSKDQVNESAIDTLKDFVAYCLIYLCLAEEVTKDID